MRRKIVSLSLILVVANLILALSTDAYAGPTSAPAADAVQPDLQKQLDRHIVVLGFRGNTLADVVDFLRDCTGVNIYVDWKSLSVAGATPDTPVTYAARDVAFKDSLDAILGGLTSSKPIGFHAISKFVVITTNSGMEAFRKIRASHPQKIPSAKLRTILNKHVTELRFNGNTLSDVVDFVRDVSGAKISVDWKSFEAAGISKNTPVDLKFRDVSLWDSLDVIFSEVSSDKATLVFTADGETLSVSAVATKQDP